MVATRRGGRENAPDQTDSERQQSSDVPATPSTDRRTRSAVKPPTSPPMSLLKRCTRASRLHSPEQSCTPVGSVHEADVSDLESCCSVLSDVEPSATRTRSRRRLPRAVVQGDEEISEVESCSSAVSASKAGQITRRTSTRRKKAPECVEGEKVKVDQVLESDSCSSVLSKSKRVTKSQRKGAQTEDTEVSDAESCISSVSGAEGSQSTARRGRSSRKSIHHIPLNLDEASELSNSPAPRSRPTRAVRKKAQAVEAVNETLSPDSEGFESGPTYSIATRRRAKSQSTGPIAVDSDLDLTDRGTPCSSRTGSGNSSYRSQVTRRSVKNLRVVLEKAIEPIKEDSSLNDSRLESTVISEDADCTLVEECESQTLEEKDDIRKTEGDAENIEKGEEVVIEPAVMAIDQQEELSAENKDGDTTEVEMMQEMIQSSEPVKACQSVLVTCEKASGITEEQGQTMDVSDVEAPSSQGDESVDAVVEAQSSLDEKMEVGTLNTDAQQVVETSEEQVESLDAVVEAQSSVDEKMVVGTLNTDAQQVVETSEEQVESIQVTSHQEHKITVDSDSDHKPPDVVVQKAKVISLLDSSDDEDNDAEEEKEVSGDDEKEEEEEDLEYKRGESSKMSETAASSVEGLFMIDTRPGEEADELYYKERGEAETKEAEQEEQDEEFVDEEGDDDDDDAGLLFSNQNLKAMSTRIDPGIRMKELGGLYINFGDRKSKPVSTSLQKVKETKIQDEVMKKSVIGPDFEKKEAVPPYSESKHAVKLKNRVERQKTTGDAWFNMKAPEITQELKGDLRVLKMRSSMDPKRFYKKNDRDGFPKYFQVGTVVDSPVDFYHSRVPKKERKRTMVEELLADAEFRQTNKRKYQQAVTEKASQAAGKRNKKKNKFHKK
ncbi:deoxynucleotidyltransferase terminal-interacting protein 2 [Solea solea]|uniref:deoxynucleotidyltransferase terminal-interacting protein 2 n=1 Tax=Solea solea TaxID=90069 RepID=UPI00272C8F34|nr:deoxynucleotidyltransferase terminal-interacting protein 2 [Solea solea]